MENKENNLRGVFLNGWHPFFWISFLIVFVYGATLFSNIVYLDDNVLVTEQYQFNKNLGNIPQAFKEDIFRTPQNGGTFYRPIERITFMLDAQFGEGAIIFMSHFSNVLLHILALCLLFAFLLKLNIDKLTAFLFALIFAIHPLTAQTVAFISGRNDSLLAIFVFPSLIFLINYLETRKNKYLFWNLIFLAFSLFTKETAAVLPGIFIFYILIFVGYKKITEDYKLYTKLFFLWLSVGIFWFLIRMLVFHNFIGNAPYNIFLSIYHNLSSLIPAIGKIFLPFDLSVFPVMQDMIMLYGILSLVLLTVWFFLSEKRNFKFIIFGLLWFFVFIVLTLIKPIGTNPEFSENRIYIPMFGFIFVILGLGMIRLPNFIKNKIKSSPPVKGECPKGEGVNILLIVSLSIILIFSIVTIYRNSYYKNKINFWKNATTTSPHFAFNHNNLGAMYYLDGNIDGAEQEYKVALALNPNEPMAHNNLGLVYANQDKDKEAEEEYKKEIEVNPGYDNVYFNLGLLYFKEKRFDEAISSLQKTLEINPNHIDALKSLVTYYYNEQNYVEVVPYANALYRIGFSLPPDLLRLIQLNAIR
ncbi:MAG: tetratricopeptide repeat protein [Candidatus Paceibacterota bacterium]